MRLQIAAEVREGHAAIAAAQSRVDLFRTLILPQAAQALEVARGAYQNDDSEFLDLLDAQRTHLDLQMAYEEALAEREMARAALALSVADWRLMGAKDD